MVRAQRGLALAAAATSVLCALAGCGVAGSRPARAARVGATSPAGRTGSGAAAGVATDQGGTPLWLYSLRMVTSTAGWALRWTADPAGPGAAALGVARTTDGGATWGAVTPPGLPTSRAAAASPGVLFALSAGRAWFAVALGGGARVRTVVFSTGDGGRSWRAGAPFPSLGVPRFLYFRGQRGWLLADLGAAAGSDAVAVFTTADGGARWSLAARTPLLTSPAAAGGAAGGLPVACGKTGISAVSGQTGWITGDCAGGRALVDVTHDGGRSWQPQALPAPVGSCPDGSSAGPPGFAGGTGYLVMTCYPRAHLFVSRDAGVSWPEVALPAGAGAYPVVQFVTGLDGFLVPGGPQGRLGDVLYRTGNGGRSWRAVPLSRRFTAPGTSLEFVSATTGFAWVSAGGATGAAAGAPPLCRTTDGGRTWHCLAPRVPPAGG